MLLLNTTSYRGQKQLDHNNENPSFIFLSLCFSPLWALIKHVDGWMISHSQYTQSSGHLHLCFDTKVCISCFVVLEPIAYLDIADVLPKGTIFFCAQKQLQLYRAHKSLESQSSLVDGQLINCMNLVICFILPQINNEFCSQNAWNQNN